ncbi:MAG: hypothetical protein LBP85_00825 [Prevotellaceae bacterium]|jgi:hypothetical protein|nr:hypothetical protein [Prevotellaceae bacterium]
MLKNRNLPLLALLLMLVSCGETEENPNRVLWGETKYYTNFLFKKYEPVIMEQTLDLDFNEDAQKFGINDIELETVKKDENGRFVHAADVIIYKNGKQCVDNILKIKSTDRSIKLGVEFASNAKEGNHTLYMRVKNTGGLDRIDDVDLSLPDNVILVHEWVIKKDDVFNPLAKILFLILTLIAILLVIWRFFIRQHIFESFKVRKLFIFYPESPMKTLKTKGCHKVICTNKRQNQSFISKFFKGKIIFEKNEFWTQDIEIVPKDRKTVRIRSQRGFTVMPGSAVTAGVTAEITNMNKKIIKLQIN